MCNFRDRSETCLYKNRRIRPAARRVFCPQRRLAHEICEGGIEPSPLFAFPNPARDYIEIDVGTGRDLSLPGNTIYVYNAIGILVLSTPVNSVDTPASGGQIKIDVSGLPPGVYFVRSGGSCTKFVKGE